MDQLELGEDERKNIIDKIKRSVANQWRNGAPSWPTVQMNCAPYVFKQLQKAGCQLNTEDLKPVCLLPRKLIESKRNYRAVAIRRKDAGKSATIQTPRVKRTRDHIKPMEWVAGDVHHIDIAFQRDDGSLCTIKGVAWLDLATNRAFVSLFLLKKGEGIRREHVIQSFIEMCSDSNWGVPTRLYLDRGGEYNWSEFVDDLFKLKYSIGVFDWPDIDIDADTVGVQRSRAYNPQSKIIETLFGAMERSSLAMLPGHIGGNRMKNKTENQGRAPKPYPGKLEDFKKSFQVALDYHHAKPQQGHLAGKTPNESFQSFIDQGWQSTLLDSDQLSIAFSTTETRCIRAGGVFSMDGDEYRHDALLSLAGIGKVIIHKPLIGNKKRLLVCDEDDRPICWANPVNVYRLGDIRGSGEQLRQSKEFNAQIREKETETDKLNLEQCMKDAIDFQGPKPSAQVKGVMNISAELQKGAELLNQEAVPPSIDEEEEKQYEKYALLDRLNNKRASGSH